MIILVTDFGLDGPYTGQMKAVLAQQAPTVPVIDLFADAPAFSPRATAYLLAAFTDSFPAESVFLVVVDPGVGSGRPAGILRANGRWYVGPGNGVFEIVIRRAVEAAPASTIRWWPLEDQVGAASATFHGRDLFAPAAATIAMSGLPRHSPIDHALPRFATWLDDLPEVVYIDAYGNAMVGVRAKRVDRATEIHIAGRPIPFQRTFSDVAVGMPVCYANANGLLEIAINQGRAAQQLGLSVGRPIELALL